MQVVFDEKDAGARFLGGEATPGHIWIRGDIRAGRSDAQRQKLMLSIYLAGLGTDNGNFTL